MQSSANPEQSAFWNGPVGTRWAAQSHRFDAMVEAFDEPFLAAAGLAPGERVLDIGCGTGLIARAAARRVGPSGRVDAIDISAPMLARARVLDAAVDGVDGEEGRSGEVVYVEGDAQTHAFGAGVYDVAISRGGVMFFADHGAAFRNIARALRPGGRLVLATPQPPDPADRKIRVLGMVRRTIAARRLDAETRGGLGDQSLESLTEPDRIREVLGAAGFADVEVRAEHASTWWGKDAEDAADFLIERAVARLAPADEGVVREEVVRLLSGYEDASGVRFPGAVWVTVAHT